ncbi:hypothetical protein D9Q98_002459 [Chlorella vulgaris]|uniref:Uncharacterized protein n=1 Tax=Chlorella vulgaris TaxID=3077 RepID=A0A9D4TTD9_CHLVU|nr:hypothetical protein D9Q98_002459 [Chlorella vulgaris]
MASRCLEGERSGQETRSSGIDPTPTKAAALGAAGELALAVLAVPGPQQLTILSHLERNDQMRLGAACTSLRQASLAWFPEVTLEVQPGETDVASLAAWLERHQACLHLLVDRDNVFKSEFSQESRVEWNDSLAALPPSLVTSLAVWPVGLRAAVSALTALTRLELESVQGFEVDSEEDDGLPCSLVSSLQPLNQLQQLSIVAVDMSGNAEEMLSPAALAGLLALRLNHCKLRQLPRALSALTRLTALDLSSNRISALAPLAALQHLQSLDLRNCGLTAVPEQLSALKALTRLKLLHNVVESGWQHLLPLVRLQELDLGSCGLTAVPQQVSVLAALSRLNLSGNEQLAGGWQHLVTLTQLQGLDLSWCGLAAVPEQVSALTALTCLDVTRNQQLAGNWQHLQPLTQLQGLDLSGCDLTAVPQQLSAWTALIRLDLSFNLKLDGSWQHLLPLTQLRDLDLEGVPLPGGVAPPELDALPQLCVVWT